MHHLTDAAVNGGGLAIILLFSLPHARLLWSRSRHGGRDNDGNYSDTRRPAWYEDKDGKSTPESVAEYDARLRRVKAANVVLAIVGVGLAVVIAVLEDGVQANGLVLACWIAVLWQVCVVGASYTTTALRLGAYSSFSSLGLLALSLHHFMRQSSSSSETFSVLPRVCQVLIAALLFLGCGSIPRRPDVFDAHGILVDPEWSSSLVSKTWYGFFERSTIAAALREDGHLEVEDLTRPAHAVRAATVADALCKGGGEEQEQTPLWRQIAWVHRWKFARQWATGMVLASSRMAPSWVLRGLLTHLEIVDEGQEFWRARLVVLGWAVLLVVIMVFETWVGHMTFSFAFSRFAIPVRNQLASSVFTKALRAKDIKTPDKSGGGGGDHRASSTKARKMQMSDTGANMIGLDVERVANFSAVHVNIPTNLTVFAEACLLLGLILGALPMLAGVLAMLCVIGVSTWSTSRYARAQRGLMSARDSRAAVVSEALSGIRQIKFSALEELWENRITDARRDEMRWLSRVFIAQGVLTVSALAVPIVLTVVSFATYGYLVGPPNAADVFACFAMFQALTGALNSAPESVKTTLDAWVSVNRIDQFLRLPEVTSVGDPDARRISIRQASIAWPSDPDLDSDEEQEDRFALRNVNVDFPSGELSIVTGGTGTGKTLLLTALLGEADILSGTVSVPTLQTAPGAGENGGWIVPEAIAYVAQIPWIENASIADNILFGLPLDRTRLDAVIEACALAADLAMFPDGERTEIGVNGVNLSGGQKWRLTLARAVYSRAGILVLDDIFSAVDAHVGQRLYERCLCGDVCRGRTVILVTHHVGLCLAKAKYLVQLGDGGVVTHAGPVPANLDDNATLPRLLALEAEEEEAKQQQQQADDGSSETAEQDVGGSGSGDGLGKPKILPPPRTFVHAEKRFRGAVAASVWTRYLAYGGGLKICIVALCVFALLQAVNMASSWWLGVWTSADDDAADNITFYLGVYCLLGLAAMLIVALRSWLLFSSSLRASHALFARFNNVVLRAPVAWFDTTPLGRILNRYSADFASADDELVYSMAVSSMSLFGLAATLISGAIVAPSVLLGLAVLVVPWRPLARGYLAAVRPCRRLASTTRATVLQSFLASVHGVATLRAFGRRAAVLARVHVELDEWSSSLGRVQLCYRWMGIRTGALAAVFSGLVAALVTLGGASAAQAGFALSFAFMTNSFFYLVLSSTTGIELAMASTERILEYADVDAEDLSAGSDVSAAWPAEGNLSVEDLVVGYAEGLPPVLNGINFSVRGGERVGIVGRTGAGKSTLALSLFRFVEAWGGRICIDGVDISKIKLKDLRSRLAIIPQDPVLFSGTIRSNLDPYGKHTDSELTDALERVHLDSVLLSSSSTSSSSSSSTSLSPLSSPTTILSTPISSGGLNLSQGQRQLLCLARAILLRPRLLVLDEATSAVDAATDALIQENIRTEFAGATLVVVAHRLATVADFHKVVVMSEGSVVEFGRPRDLWGEDEEDDEGERKERGAWRSLCERSGEAEKLRDLVFGNK